jgi:hypothetical protein
LTNKARRGRYVCCVQKELFDGVDMEDGDERDDEMTLAVDSAHSFPLFGEQARFRRKNANFPRRPFMMIMADI